MPGSSRTETLENPIDQLTLDSDGWPLPPWRVYPWWPTSMGWRMGGGEWYIDVSDSGPKVEKGNPGTASCTISISTDDFQKLHENPQANGMQLFFAGKLKVTGDQMQAMKLQKLFAMG